MSTLANSIGADGSFCYYAPISLFEKADAPAGQRRRFGGIASTESRDQDDEIVIQKGLDWSYFLTNGWFNDNHSKRAGGVVGYPTGVQFYKAGDPLPDGAVAKANCHWTEGYLLEGVPAADDIWRLGIALKKAGGHRQLGQSIEGKIRQRLGTGGDKVAKAEVHHVAITHVPTNAGTSCAFLIKALMSAAEADGDEDPEDESKQNRAGLPRSNEAKAMTAGAGPAGPPPAGTPTTGEGAGRILTPQSIEARKSLLGIDEQFALVRRRYPHLPAAACGRLLDTIQTLASVEAR